MSNVVEKIKAKVDEVLHKDHTTTGTHHTDAHGGITNTSTHNAGTHTTGTNTTGYGNNNPTTGAAAGPHSSNLANKLDPRVDSDLDGGRNAGLATHGPGATHNAATGPARDTAGPHASNTLNRVDPRVDSDADGSRNAGLSSHHGPGGNTGGYGAGQNTHAGSTNVGPHSSNLANKLDPRVDSDADGRGNLGAANYGPGGANTGGYGSGQNTYGGQGSTNVGPHSSNVANKLDPRVDSDADGRGNLGAANYGPGGANTGGYGSGQNTYGSQGSTNVGPHSSNVANKLDPRVDSDADGRGNLGAANYGPGATNTTGGNFGGDRTY